MTEPFSPEPPSPLLPAAPPRRTLTGITSVAWEHPADRAALNTLRALPYFDDVLRKVMGFFGERGIRQMFLANAVRVSPGQRPKLYALYEEVLATMDYPGERPQLYVTQTPLVNAYAIGFERPFIVMNTGMLKLMDREGRRNILAHELGHVMSGHATYTTLALIIAFIGLRNLPFLAGMVLLPFELALFEWYRKAEFSADRAGLLGSQDPIKSMEVFLKLAGGTPKDDDVNLNEFLVQASEYETEGGAWDTVLKVINTAFRTHPHATVRAAELQRWVQSGEYDRILNGQYPRRGDPSAERPLTEDYAAASAYYSGGTRDVVNQFGAAFDRARDAFTDAFKGPPTT